MRSKLKPPPVQPLDLSALKAGTPGITSAGGEDLSHAAAVCLESQSHSNGVQMAVGGHMRAALSLSWPKTTDQIRRMWNDLQVATEWGACGIAVLITQHLTEWTVVERSKKGTGFDYWLGKKDASPDDLFQNKARLEVSGILNGGDPEVRSRVKQKVEQLARGGVQLPAWIVVVEFGKPSSNVTNP